MFSIHEEEFTIYKKIVKEVVQGNKVPLIQTMFTDIHCAVIYRVMTRVGTGGTAFRGPGTMRYKLGYQHGGPHFTYGSKCGEDLFLGFLSIFPLQNTTASYTAE